VFEHADVDAEAESSAAMAKAKSARDQAQCLRTGSASVDAAARRMRWARGANAVLAAKKSLDQALVKLDQCWDAPFEGNRPATATGAAATATSAAPPTVHGHFGFGQIRVEEGPVDSHTIARPLRDHAKRYLQCYDQALKRTPELRGWMYFRVRLERRETHSIPTSVAIPAASLADDPVRRCLAQALMTTAFPEHADASTFTVMMAFATVAD
jgi:hypothetical protein